MKNVAIRHTRTANVFENHKTKKFLSTFKEAKLERDAQIYYQIKNLNKFGKIGTINYEVVTRINSLLPRIYK